MVKLGMIDFVKLSIKSGKGGNGSASLGGRDLFYGRPRWWRWK